MSPSQPSTTVESVPNRAEPTPEPEVFGVLGPVLVLTFVLWFLVVAAVGSSV